MTDRLPLDGYIRVSQVAGREGDRFQSPEQQREAIAAWATAHGERIGVWHEDLDQSGGTMDRPGMRRALARVEDGVSGGLVVARLDRFARTLIGGLTTIELLHERGARVVSVAESLDPATPMGRAMLGLLLIMGQWQRDQADEALGVSQQRAASAGRFPGRTPYGYRRTSDGLTEVDVAAAAAVERIFQARAGGRGWQGIARDLHRDEVASPGGGRWANSTVMGIVRSEAPLGVFCGPRGLRVEGAWPAIVSRELWDRANSIRGTRDDSRQHEDRLLAGVARCAGCRRIMQRAVNPEGFVSYSCRGIGCPGKCSIGAKLLDEHLAGLLDERLAQLSMEPRPVEDGGELQRLLTARDQAAGELEAWRDDLELRGALGDEDWRAGMLARARARDGAETDLSRYQSQAGIDTMLPEGVIPQLDELPWNVQRQLVSAALHSVFVRPSLVRGPGARRHVAPRVLVVWQDDPRLPELPGRAGAGPEPLPAVAWPST